MNNEIFKHRFFGGKNKHHDIRTSYNSQFTERTIHKRQLEIFTKDKHFEVLSIQHRRYLRHRYFKDGKALTQILDTLFGLHSRYTITTTAPLNNSLIGATYAGSGKSVGGSKQSAS